MTLVSPQAYEDDILAAKSAADVAAASASDTLASLTLANTENDRLSTEVNALSSSFQEASARITSLEAQLISSTVSTQALEQVRNRRLLDTVQCCL